MGGWKTWLGAIGLGLLGVFDIVNGSAETGITKIVGAVGLLGVGHKVDKARKGE
tara:strand:+ start:1431 stop:1592 length:162 start_codon:yes stop_codon:yes gene_type:complete